jgi:dTDP-4-amino-4,6-dideoxygalactose transaminase
MDGILELAARRDLKVIEDACQAHGARFRGGQVGSLGDIAAFSFYPGKNLGAYGDAGMLTTNSTDVAERVRMLRNYGQRQKYDHVHLAWNRRMDTLQAAVLRVKLRHLEDWNRARRRVASLYDELLDLPEVRRPFCDPRAEHVYHLYVVEVDNRDLVLESLCSKGIGAGVHYPVPIHLQEAYRQREVGVGSFPVTEAAASRVLSLPIFAEISEAQVAQVAEALIETVRGARSAAL